MQMKSRRQERLDGERGRIRFMRIVVMYDLPVADAQDRHEYSRFRQFLVGDGYTRLQNSVYTRLAVDTKNAEAAISRLKASLPEAGLVQVLRVSEASFCSMLTLCGSPSDEGHFVTGEDFIVL